MAREDEAYIIGLCDRVLGLTASRQHRFDFLLGDVCRDGKRRRLPVDAFYDPQHLAIEYRERQHSEAVKIMDSRMTISGCSRGAQRRKYDQRRRDVLPQHGITLLELDFSMFDYDRRKRICRNPVADEAVVRTRLRALRVID